MNWVLVGMKKARGPVATRNHFLQSPDTRPHTNNVILFPVATALSDRWSLCLYGLQATHRINLLLVQWQYGSESSGITDSVDVWVSPREREEIFDWLRAMWCDGAVQSGVCSYALKRAASHAWLSSLHRLYLALAMDKCAGRKIGVLLQCPHWQGSNILS